MRSLAFLCLAAAVTPAFALWPIPSSYTNGSSVVWIDSDIKVTYNGASVCWTPTPGLSMERAPKTKQIQHTQLPMMSSSNSTGNSTTFNSKSIVQSAVQRALDTILSAELVPWKLVPRHQLPSIEPSSNSSQTYIKTLKITQTSYDNSSNFTPLAGEVDESYELYVSANGTASITATSSTGILWALQSFTQLFYTQSAGAGIYTNLAPVAITDSPKFAHRGLNMDVSRSWYPVSDILRTIDALAWNKFNILHLHITDAQSWPIDIPALPELSAAGAYNTGLTYSPADIAQIQSYAVARGVNVVLEMDMPGHTAAIALSHPELITAYNAKPWATYCAEPPCGELLLNSPEVDDFLETLFADVLPRVAPYTAYFHTGGDEVNVQAYLLDPTVQSNDSAVIQPLMQRFVDRNHDQVRAEGLTPMVWEEMLLTWNVTLGEDVVVQSWGAVDNSLMSITDLKHKVIASDYNYWYLDCGRGQWLDFGNGESFDTYYPFNDYCSPTKNWRLIYSFDPVANMTAEQASYVLGGEVSIWSEQTDPVNLDDLVWPRASAAGEVLWSGRQDASGQNRSQLDASPRLAEMRERLVARGVRAGPVQMVFCTQFDSSECSL